MGTALSIFGGIVVGLYIVGGVVMAIYESSQTDDPFSIKTVFVWLPKMFGFFR